MDNMLHREALQLRLAVPLSDAMAEFAVNLPVCQIPASFDRPDNWCYISVFCGANLSYCLSLLSLDRSLWPICASERN
jgi:hypothetical protein